MMRPDDCTVDHLQTGITASRVIESIEYQLPQARKCPTPELAIHARPFAEILRQITPGHAGSCNPENTIQNKAVVLRSPATASPTRNRKWFKTGPFLVAQQTSDHASLLQSYLEPEDN
jgi:hypothetical protein